MIDTSDMDAFLSKTKNGMSGVDVSDLDSFLVKIRTAPDAPNYANAKPSQNTTTWDELKRGAKEMGDFVELGVGTKRFSYDNSEQKTNEFLQSILGQKGELVGAGAGAATGLNYASKAPIPNPVVKAGVMGLSTAIGGGLGYLGDKGKQATPEGTMSAMGNAVAGEAIGAGIPVVAGKLYNKAGEAVSNKIANYVYGNLDPEKAKAILELASAKGVRLLPNQVADNKAIDQLLGVIGQNPVMSERINRLNKSNKSALMTEINVLLNDMGVDSVALRSADNVDPLGTSLKSFLNESKAGRSKEIQNAYKEFEQIGGVIPTATTPIRQEVEALKDLAQSMPNPAGYERAVDFVLGKLQSKEVTTLDLNNIIKQINYNVKNLPEDEFAIKSGYQKMKGILDGHLDQVAKLEGSDKALSSAKGLYSQKRTIYDRPEIKKVLTSADPEEIYDTLLRGKSSITNAQVVRDELLRTKDGEKVLGTLARRQIDEALYKTRMSQSIFKDGELNAKSFLKVMDEVDYRQLEILSSKEQVGKLHEMRELVNLIAKQDSVLSGTGGGLNTMGIIKSGAMNAMASIFRIRTLGEVLTSDVAHNQMLELLRTATRSTHPNAVPQTLQSINQKQQEILNAIQR